MSGRRIECVGAVVTDPDGRLLLVLRGREPGAGLWSIPGGKVESGESLVEAVAREVLEETALKVEVGEYVGTVERPALDGDVFVIHDYRARVVGSLVASAGDDAANVGWFGKQDLATVDCVPGLIEALAAWRIIAL